MGQPLAPLQFFLRGLQVRADILVYLGGQLDLRLLGDVFDVGKLVGEGLWCFGFFGNGFRISKI